MILLPYIADAVQRPTIRFVHRRFVGCALRTNQLFWCME